MKKVIVGFSLRFLLLVGIAPYSMGADMHLASEQTSLIEMSAEYGNAQDQFNLGSMYFDGRWVEQDYRKAFQWFKKAADQGLASAQNILGYMYDNGLGVRQDYIKARQLYEQKTEQEEEQDKAKHRRLHTDKR